MRIGMMADTYKPYVSGIAPEDADLGLAFDEQHGGFYL